MSRHPASPASSCAGEALLAGLTAALRRPRLSLALVLQGFLTALLSALSLAVPFWFVGLDGAALAGALEGGGAAAGGATPDPEAVLSGVADAVLEIEQAVAARPDAFVWGVLVALVVGTVGLGVWSWFEAAVLGALAAPPGDPGRADHRAHRRADSWAALAAAGRRHGWAVFWFANLALLVASLVLLAATLVLLPAGWLAEGGGLAVAAGLGCLSLLAMALGSLGSAAWAVLSLPFLVLEGGPGEGPDPANQSSRRRGSMARALGAGGRGWRLLRRRPGPALLVLAAPLVLYGGLTLALAVVDGLAAFALAGTPELLARLVLHGLLLLLGAPIQVALLGAVTALARGGDRLPGALPGQGRGGAGR